MPTESIPEPPETTADNLAKAVWPRFKRSLATAEAVVQFIGTIAEISGVEHEWREEGLMIFNVVPTSGDEVPSADAASDPVPLDSDEVHASTDGPEDAAVESSAADQPTAACDASNGDAA